MIRLPDFLIVGAMKAATSSFAAALSQHPQINMAPRELHYFNSEENYAQGIEHYATNFADIPPEIIAGEKTPTYSYHPLAAKRIADDLPQVKIIWLFREPVSRAYSHYNFFVGKGREWRSFAKAVNREMQGEELHFTQRYLDRSIYVKQVEHFLKYFPKSQMLFLLYEDFRIKRPQVLQQTCEFLNISPFKSADPEFAPKNITHLPRSSFLQWIAYRMFRNRSFTLYKMISQINRRSSAGYEKLDMKTEQQLKNFFEPYNSSLSELTGLDLSCWLEK